MELSLTMKEKNKFSEDTRLLFSDAWKCFWCGKNKADILHHTVGRGTGESVVESSALNASLLCNNSCHLPNHSELKNDNNTKMLLEKTYNYLNSIGYEFTELDANFVEKYVKYYE